MCRQDLGVASALLPCCACEEGAKLRFAFHGEATCEVCLQPTGAAASAVEGAGCARRSGDAAVAPILHVSGPLCLMVVLVRMGVTLVCLWSTMFVFFACSWLKAVRRTRAASRRRAVPTPPSPLSLSAPSVLYFVLCCSVLQMFLFLV